MTITNRTPMTIAVRGFAEVPEPRRRGYYPDTIPASPWSLVFDTETTDDERQALRFGVFQLREKDKLKQFGLFYVPDELTKGELAILRRFSVEKGLELMTHRQFLDDVFLGTSYGLGAAYIGLNLPFDISRLAIGHSEAKPSVRKPTGANQARPPTNRSMVGGFSFKFTDDTRKPRIQVKHLNSKCALIRFTVPGKQDNSGSGRRRGVFVADQRGHFIDIRSLASALLSGSWGLSSLGEILDTEHRKLETEEHGKITREYLEYAVGDVQVTWECYCELAKRYAKLGLKARPEKIISEASLGKAYLDEMRVRPWFNVQPDFPRDVIGAVMSSYFGGRAEVHARRIPVPVVYCDFLSMYPTVCVLMKLWSFVIASGIKTRNATPWTRDFLEAVTLEDMRNPDTWRKLTVLVRVQPEADAFPIRAKYDGANRSIGLNLLTSDKPMWFTLADCIASKLLTGKAPKVLEAIAFRPDIPQDGLMPVSVAGNKEYEVHPLETDFLKRLIELRKSVKDRLKTAGTDEREKLQAEQQALKILANSLAYGIFVELNPNTHGRPVLQLVYGSGDESFEVSTETVEEPGKFFNPVMGTLITGAARLMLALTERVGTDHALTWAFCDTDGIALTPETARTTEELVQAANNVRDWFKPLSPYEGSPDILKLEDENYRTLDGKLTSDIEPLYCFAISAKRYALFNQTEDGRIILRKATAHGLGHLMSPYEDSDEANPMPTPVMNLHELGLRRWHADLWQCLVASGISTTPDQLDLSRMIGLDRPAVCRYTATTPDLLHWFDKWNVGKDYAEQVRPFGFMMSYQPKRELGSSEVPRASAPYNRDPVKGAERCFDRESSESIAADQLRSVRQALAMFHVHPESKFDGGNYTDRGFTRRRHVKAIAIEHIGKEANRWEDSFAAGEPLSEEQTYGDSPKAEAERLAVAIEQCRKCNRRELAAKSGVCLREVTRIVTGKVTPTKELLEKLEVGSTLIVRQSTKTTLS